MTALTSKATLLLALVLILAGCKETHTTDASESYYLWSGKKPESDLKIIHGDYKQTSGPVKEYTLFMELQASADWRNNFINLNELAVDDDEWSIPADAPAWFKPDNTYKVWKQPQPFAESIYFEDTTSGKMFIYEVD